MNLIKMFFAVFCGVMMLVGGGGCINANVYYLGDSGLRPPPVPAPYEEWKNQLEMPIQTTGFRNNYYGGRENPPDMAVESQIFWISNPARNLPRAPDRYEIGGPPMYLHGPGHNDHGHGHDHDNDRQVVNNVYNVTVNVSGDGPGPVRTKNGPSPVRTKSGPGPVPR